MATAALGVAVVRDYTNIQLKNTLNTRPQNNYSSITQTIVVEGNWTHDTLRKGGKATTLITRAFS